LEVALPTVVLVVELTRSLLSSGDVLPEAISKALGISLSEVLDLYFGGINEGRRESLVWDVIGRCRMNEEDEAWLEEESRRRDAAEISSYCEDREF
jgi:hypothetical protein